MGDGESAAAGDTMTVSFVGTLYPSGQQFAKNKDFVFELGKGETMPGFDSALEGTKVGCRRIIRVPPSLAFGARGTPAVVMSIIFCGAPIVNAVVAITKSNLWGQLRWQFVAGIVLAAIGGCLVTLYKPVPKKAPTPAATAAVESQG